MTKFLFWNINKKPLELIVANLALLHDIDVIALVESELDPVVMLRALNPIGTASYFYVPQLGCTKVELFTRFSPDFIEPVFEIDRLTIRTLELPGLTSILLAINHFPSKLRWSDASQGTETVELANDIKDAEVKQGHSRTVVFGDLNMNPFEDGLIFANGLHAVMSRRIASGNSRTVNGKQYPFFYNPMWTLFGDRDDSPPGTFYYRDSQQKVYFWNMFDQVLIRPALLSRFNTDDLQVLQHDGTTSLLTRTGIPDRNIGSDHLPLMFTLNL